jgi:hypothetical protein
MFTEKREKIRGRKRKRRKKRKRKTSNQKVMNRKLKEKVGRENIQCIKDQSPKNNLMGKTH